jgi:hypothetical protein
MMNDATQSERAADSMAAPRTSTHDMLARCKRASLHKQTKQAVWQLGALARRAEREAPEVHLRLRAAVEALQLLNARLAMESAGELPLPVGPATRAGSALGAGELRQGRLALDVPLEVSLDRSRTQAFVGKGDRGDSGAEAGRSEAGPDRTAEFF